MEGNARRAVVATVLLGMAMILPVGSTAVASLGQPGRAPDCIYDHLTLRSAPGTCRPRARAYPRSIHGSVRRAIYDASLTFGIPYGILLQIARCESNLNARAADGKHFGLYQFLPATFKQGAGALRKETGIKAKSYWNALDAAYVAAYYFVRGNSYFWACETAPAG